MKNLKGIIKTNLTLADALQMLLNENSSESLKIATMDENSGHYNIVFVKWSKSKTFYTLYEQYRGTYRIQSFRRKFTPSASEIMNPTNDWIVYDDGCKYTSKREI